MCFYLVEDELVEGDSVRCETFPPCSQFLYLLCVFSLALLLRWPCTGAASLSLSPSASLFLSLSLSHLVPLFSPLYSTHPPQTHTHTHLKPAQLSARVSKCCNHVIWWDLFFFPAKSTSRLLASELMWTWEVSDFPNCQYIPFLSASVLF